MINDLLSVVILWDDDNFIGLVVAIKPIILCWR